MKYNPIQANMAEITLHNGVKVLFSYCTPVASWENGQFYKTEKKWSKTTTRHINKWLDGVQAIEQPQEYFDNLLGGV
jgi:hypothetical protein